MLLVNRVNSSLLSYTERRFLEALCLRMPQWVTPNMMTILGAMGAFACLCGYTLSGLDKSWLWLAVAGVMVNWLGDSLDGSLARHRRMERNVFGFFVDHLTDTLAIALIAVGIGLSPFARLDVSLTLLGAYYVLVILSMATVASTGVFKITYHGAGPTEVRLLVILATLAAIWFSTPTFALGRVALSVYDVGMLGLAAVMVVVSVVEALRTGRALAVIDPRRL